MKYSDERFWELDFLRGIAIILMILIHFIYDLNHLQIINYRLWEGPFDYFSKIIASFFFLLVGISLTVSSNRLRFKVSKKKLSHYFIIRGLKLILLGIIITVVSIIIIPERYVLFGVLHCIGTSIILSIPFIDFKKINIVIGSTFILIGIYLNYLTVGTSWLLPLGLRPPQYYTIDFFPLLPWFGVVLIGISIGHYLYPEAKRGIQIPINEEIKALKHICFIGRHSLKIYFIHQPVLFSIIFILILIFL